MTDDIDLRRPLPLSDLLERAALSREPKADSVRTSEVIETLA